MNYLVPVKMWALSILTEGNQMIVMQDDLRLVMRGIAVVHGFVVEEIREQQRGGDHGGIPRTVGGRALSNWALLWAKVFSPVCHFY